MYISKKFSGCIHEHPVFVSALGVSPLAARCETLLSAVTIAAVTAGVFVLSSLSLSCLRRLVPHSFRLVYMLVITATWVTFFDLLLQAWAYELRMNLDIYIPLLAMNSLLLMLLETTSLRRSAAASTRESLIAVAAVTAVIVTTGLVREGLTRGAILTDARLYSPMAADWSFSVFPGDTGMTLFNAGSGALIAVGCVIALVRYMSGTDKTDTGN